MLPALMGKGLCGATVARLTPDQKAACSNHVRVIAFKITSSATKYGVAGKMKEPSPQRDWVHRNIEASRALLIRLGGLRLL